MLIATKFLSLLIYSKIKESPQLMEIVHGSTIKVSNISDFCNLYNLNIATAPSIWQVLDCCY